MYAPSPNIVKPRLVQPRPLWVLDMEERARYEREGYPVLRFRGDISPGGMVSKDGPITNFNANGKNYTDANGVEQFAPAGTPYCHHVFRNGRYEPVGFLVETGDAPQVPSAFLGTIMGAGQIVVEYTPDAATSTDARVMFDCRHGGGSNGFVFFIDTAAKSNLLTCTVNGVPVLSGSLAWVAGQTYVLAVMWLGNVWSLYRDGVRVAIATRSALSTIGATAKIGTRYDGTLPAQGWFRRIEARAA